MIKDRENKIYSANFPGLVDLVRDESGRVCYLGLGGNDGIQVVDECEFDGIKYIPPDQEHLPFLLPRADEVIKYYRRGKDKQLFEEVLSYLHRFSSLSEPQWYIIACKVFLTYIQDHPEIHYMPMILFYAVPGRGKSRTGKAVTYISYRGVHLVELREANLFRYSENLQATLFFDIMDLWKTATKGRAQDILLSRFEKGAKVARVTRPDEGAFKDTKHFSIYGPTLMATNEPVHRILDSRCIAIDMPNRPGHYEDPTKELGLELKERLTAWRARMLNQQLPEVDPVNGISGRLWDISKPLLQVCRLVSPEGMGQLIPALFEVAVRRTGDKRMTTEAEILAELKEMAPREIPEWTVETKDLLDKLNERRDEPYRLTPQGIGKRLKAMGILTRIQRGYSRIYLNRQDLELLCEEYGIQQPSVGHTPHEILPNSTTPQGVNVDIVHVELAEQQTAQGAAPDTINH